MKKPVKRKPRSSKEPTKRTLQQAAAEEAATCQRIGRFIFLFSQLEFTIQVVLARHLKLSDEIGQIVTANLDFARACNILKAVAKITLKDDAAKLANLTKALDASLKLNNDHRLPVVHSLWASGYGAGLAAQRSNRLGGPSKWHYEDASQLEKAAQEAEDLMPRVMVFPEKSP